MPHVVTVQGAHSTINAAHRSAQSWVSNHTIFRMVQVVYNPADATVFLPRLLPALEKATQTIPDPEARAVVEDAHKALQKLGEDGAAAASAGVADQQVGLGSRLKFDVTGEHTHACFPSVAVLGRTECFTHAPATKKWQT